MSTEKPNLRYLEFSPEVNPLLEPKAITIKRRYVDSGVRRELMDSDGVVQAATVIRNIEEKDDAEFVKVFAAGVSASYDLSRTGQRVFQAVLDEYQRTPMQGGFADAVYLSWFGDGLSGRDVGMSEKTFQRGLRELLGKAFLAPKSPNVYWVNPALFFKGDRVMFIREYRRRSARLSTQETLEDRGQQRLEM
jgi:AraC-like DNA-binding protein